MAVSIDTVYQRVLAIANKEQRGYITPQEFNLLANQAQVEMFEQYFYDINQFSKTPGNDTEYSDVINILNEKIAIFERSSSPSVSSGAFTLPSLYRLGSLFYNNGTDYIEIERVSNKKIRLLNQTPLVKPSITRPVYVQTSETAVQIHPTTVTNVTCNYTAKPTTVEWTYVLGSNNEALFLSDNVVNFDLHKSEEAKLVIKILELSGVVIKQPDLYQVGDKEEIETIQQEKR
jgi:hypothetical protein